MASNLDRRSVADALAGALVLADLSKTKKAAGFAIEVSRVSQWAQENGDEVVLALTQEIQDLLAAIKGKTTSVADATDLIGQLITVMLEAPEAEDAAGFDASSHTAARAAETATPDPATPHLVTPDPVAPDPVAPDPAAPTAPPAKPEVLDAKNNIYAQDETVLSDFVSGAREQLDEAEAILSAGMTGSKVDVGALFRCFHTLKGIAGFLSLDDMANTAHAVETSLDKVRSGKAEMTEDVVESGLAALDRIRTMVSSVDGQRKDAARANRTSSSRAEQVRVDAGRLDDLLDAIGELVVAESELANIVLRLHDEQATRSLERLGRIARDMQESATSLRMVGLGPTFRKMTRVVRDMVAHSGKKVDFKVSGADTELDRAIVDGVSDPLVHLLRNALDHGIESPPERAAAGKAEVATVELRAYHRSGSVHIEVADDGRGIDADALVAKAAALGIEFDREDPLSLIFMPGFSTASTVTEISGRGVGMDAVATAVSRLRGQLDVQSVPGKGTVVSIRLPLTLAVIDGIVVVAGGDRYVVPTEFVERTVSIAEGQVVSAAGRSEVFVLGEDRLAVYPITVPMGGTLLSGNAVVVLHDAENRFALVVDEVIGQQSLVIKALSGPVTKAAGVAGAALMGDGKAALVIDPFGMSKAVRNGWRGDAPPPVLAGHARFGGNGSAAEEVAAKEDEENS